MSRTTIRPFKLQRRPAPSLEQVSIEKLLEITSNQDRIIEQLMGQLAEANLRIRYLMETFKYEKPSLLIGSEKEVKTLYELYISGDRARFLRRLDGIEQQRLKDEHARQSLSTDGSGETIDGKPATRRTGVDLARERSAAEGADGTVDGDTADPGPSITLNSSRV